MSRHARLPSSLWLATHLLGCWFPAWCAMAFSGVIAAACWQRQGTAPDTDALCIGWSAALWLLAYWLAAAWPAALAGPAAADPARRAANLLAGLLATTAAIIPLACALLGVLFAYDSGASIQTVRPLDIAQLEVTVPALLTRLGLLAGPAYLLASLALLALLRSLLGYRAGTAGWLYAGLVLHAPLYGGPDLVSLPVTFGDFARLCIAQLTNPDLLQADQIFGPLRLWLGGIWLASLSLAGACLALRPARVAALDFFPLSMGAGLLACGLRSLSAGRHWVADSTTLAPDSPAALAACLVCTVMVVWACLAAADFDRARQDLRRNWWILGAAFGLFLFAAQPLLAAHSVALPALCANGGLALLAVAVLLALQLALARFLSAGRLQQPDSLARLRAGLSMPVLLLALLLLFPGGNADPAAAPPLATLAAGFASTEQRAHAGLVLSSLLGAGAGAWWLSQPRRYRLSRRSPAAG